MRALLQRVSGASVDVEGETIARIGPGLLALVCAMEGDGGKEADALAAKCAKLRIFADADRKMNRSLLDTGGACLVVSQFTLAADASKGNRPSYAAAAAPELARGLCDRFAAALRGLGAEVRCGRFGADMRVALVNDGPVTIWLDSGA